MITVYILPSNVRRSWDWSQAELMKNSCLVFETESIPDLSIAYKRDGQLFSIHSLHHKDDFAVGKAMMYRDETPVYEYKDEITCPYCRNKVESWGKPDSSDNEICEYCGSEFSYERIYTIDYKTKPVKLKEVTVL